VNDFDITPRTKSRRRRGLASGIAVGAAVLAGTGVALVTSTSSAGAAPSSAPSAAHSGAAVSSPRHHVTVLRFGVKFSDHYVVDVPPLGKNKNDISIGDYALFSDQLLDRTGHVVGTEAGSGLITKVTTTEAQIFFTLAIQLPHGQITASGLSSPAPSKELAITGGTGRYVGAEGRLNLLEHGDGTGSLVITLAP
jgi:hypothetical protein